MTWPQLIQRNHSPSDIGRIRLKLWISIQYRHRIASGIGVRVWYFLPATSGRYLRAWRVWRLDHETRTGKHTKKPLQRGLYFVVAEGHSKPRWQGQ
jgi:hypothetical protein